MLTTWCMGGGLDCFALILSSLSGHASTLLQNTLKGGRKCVLSSPPHTYSLHGSKQHWLLHWDSLSCKDHNFSHFCMTTQVNFFSFWNNALLLSIHIIFSTCLLLSLSVYSERTGPVFPLITACCRRSSFEGQRRYRLLDHAHLSPLSLSLPICLPCFNWP